MNKIRFAIVALIGAIPAAALFIFLVMAVVDKPIDNMTTNVKILTFFTMALGAFVALGMPFGILFLGPKTEQSDETDEQSSATEDDHEEEDFGIGGIGEESAAESEEEMPSVEMLSEDGIPSEEMPSVEMLSEDDADIYESDDE